VTEEELEEIVDRFLEAGVPPTAIAHALEVDPVVVRSRASELRVRQYGVAELAEGVGQLQWEALDEAKAMIRDAPYTQRARFVMAILSKTMSLTARQAPETVNEMRRDLLDLMTQVGVGSDDLLGGDPGTDSDKFVVALEVDEGEDQEPDDRGS
jgi:hypothetical protein